MEAKSLAMLFDLNHLTLKQNTAGLCHEDSLIQPQPEGNCLNWVLGHIVAGRNEALRLLGKTPIWSEAETNLYKRGSSPITGSNRAEPLEKLLADLDLSQELLIEELNNISQEGLSAPARDKTVGEYLAILHFHEAYHAGQIGLLRRLAGKEGAIR